MSLFARPPFPPADGNSVTSEPTTPPWTEKAPPTDEELDAKFRLISAQTLPDNQVDTLATMLWDIENLKSVNLILEQLQI